MLARNPSLLDAFNNKVNQLKTLSLSSEELKNVEDVLISSICSVQERNLQESCLCGEVMKSSYEGYMYGAYQYNPQAINANLFQGNSMYYDMQNYGNFDEELQGYGYMNLNSSLLYSNIANSYMKNIDSDFHDSTISTMKKSSNSVDDLKQTSKSQKNLPIISKIKLLQRLLEEISDDSQVLINGKPKNKSQKIRKSNRHSNYRGVSRNGKKWQVMIIGSIKKKYFGGIINENEAAVFYDKLSILTNGLAAKTNFNYTKSDLISMIPDLERLEPIVAN